MSLPVRQEPPVDEIAQALGGNVQMTSVVSEVAKRLLAYFTKGDVRPGTRLPPERQLAASLGVGRSAVREALAALDVLGIVHVKPGSGSYLRGTASELLPQTLTWGLMLGERRTRDIIELRHILEVEAARHAAERASDDHIERLEAYLTQMGDNADNLETFVEADMHFHLEIGAASGNVVLRDMLQIVRSLLRIWTERALRDYGEVPLTLEQHAAVFRAIKARDAQGAAAAMSEHMESAGQRLLRAAEA